MRIFELILSLLVVALILPVATRRLPIPPASALILGGMVLAAIPGIPAVALHPDLIMLLFLPPLLMSSAVFTVWRDFRAELRPVLMLAIGAVTFTTWIVGCAAKWVAPSLPWAACFALGAIVSPPDAVAAKAVLHHLHLPRRLMTILEGESLINDASGLLLYRFAVAAALTGTFHATEAGLSFVWLSVGGVLIGYITGRISIWIMKRLQNPHESVLTSFLTAWVTYMIAEHIGVSSVLAVVTCGLVVGMLQHGVLTARARTEIIGVWRFVVTVFETLVFVLIGLSLRGVLGRLGGVGPALHEAGPLALAVVLTVIISRLLWVVPGMLISLRATPTEGGPALPKSPAAWIVGWAGMRGVVSLAAALALPEDFPGRDLLLFARFAVIAVTVLFQGSTLGVVIRWALGSKSHHDTGPQVMELHARLRVSHASVAYLESLPTDGPLKTERENVLAMHRRRLQVTEHIGESGEASLEQRRVYFGIALAALAAGRAELLQMHRSGALHDSILRPLEAELDLEELRLRRLAGEPP